MYKKRIAPFRFATDNTFFMDQSDNGEWCDLLTYKIGIKITILSLARSAFRKKRVSQEARFSFHDLERAL